MDRETLGSSGFAEINGTRLYYEIAGSGHHLVLIHGFTVDRRVWDAQLDFFAQNFRVVRYDLRGYGRSALPPIESYSDADDLKALLDHLGIEQAHVVGLSKGGGVAVQFTLTYPRMVDQLVLADSTLGGYQWQEFGSAFASVSATARESGIPAAKKAWLGLDIFAPAQEKPDVAARLRQMIADYSGWHLVNNDPVRELDPPPIEQLDRITAPTLVIVGERDIPDFHRIANIITERVPNARKAVIQGAGHVANMEVPDEFDKAVLGFLEHRGE